MAMRFVGAKIAVSFEVLALFLQTAIVVEIAIEETSFETTKKTEMDR
jgi:hypothetical protein